MNPSNDAANVFVVQENSLLITTNNEMTESDFVIAGDPKILTTAIVVYMQRHSLFKKIVLDAVRCLEKSGSN